jgi:hypothetical protein
MATTKSLKQPLLSVLGLIVLIAALWCAFAIIKGVLGAVLGVLIVVLAALLVWKLVKAGSTAVHR